MAPVKGIGKKLKTPTQDVLSNAKTSVTCSNVPESLFDSTTSKKHFSKFGRLQKIRLFPKRQMCIVEYEQPTSAEKAVLNAGAYDGFMFDVTRTKPRVRKRSKKEDDPDWVPDSDVEEELSAMSGAPSYVITRNKSMDVDKEVKKPSTITKVATPSPLRKKVPQREKPTISQPVSGVESPVAVSQTQTTMNTVEAATELHQLRNKISFTPDEQWMILDARDKILRAWGGTGSRVKIGGAIIGTCQDMCPEKELLHRKAEHQMMTLETIPGSDGEADVSRAVKQFTRSSADQETPMCYELRPAHVLIRTCSYLLHEIADTTRQVSLADWFLFMWDRLRSIRKDITQQALCCAESIRLVEMCARFHAHCAARLADLEHTQFDQRLNSDNLTKCLQTLKYMYADVDAELRPQETEFRGYVALLNLGDANFWWEIKQLPLEIQKSAPIVFAIQVFNALDNNNYVRFFRLVKEKATYLQACILLRYFNDVRARALARIVKAYSPRGGSRYPAADLMSALAFESIENMKSFISHYGLRLAKTDDMELTVILDRNQFIEDSDPYPMARSIKLIESKRQSTVAEVIAGGKLPKADYSDHPLYTSFTKDGRLKESAIFASDQGYDTINESNKDIRALKAEFQKMSQFGKSVSMERAESKSNLFTKPDTKILTPKPKSSNSTPVNVENKSPKLFLFKPAIPVAPTEIITNSPEKIFSPDVKNVFSFSKPQEFIVSKIIVNTKAKNLFGMQETKNLFASAKGSETNIFGRLGKVDEHKTPFSSNLFTATKPQTNIFKKSEELESKSNLFTATKSNMNIFQKPEGTKDDSNLFTPVKLQESIFNKPEELKSTSNLFSLPRSQEFTFKIPEVPKSKSSIFTPTNVQDNTFKKSEETKSIFSTPSDNDNSYPKNIFASKVEDSVATKVTNTDQNIFAVNKTNIFANTEASSNSQTPKSVFGSSLFTSSQIKEDNRQNNIFGSFGGNIESNVFAKSNNQQVSSEQSIFATNGETVSNKLSPGTVFKSAFNSSNESESPSYSIFHSKNNKAQTVADNILQSVNSFVNPAPYEFNQEDDEPQTLQKFNEEKVKWEEDRKLEELIKKEEERKQEELKQIQEEQRREQERIKQEEQKRLEEKRKEEQKRLEEKRKEEQRKQEELRRKLEEEKKAEMKRKAEEEERNFKKRVETESVELVEELTKEINCETVQDILKEEVTNMQNLVKYAKDVTNEILVELCDEISQSELKAEKFWTDKLMRKGFDVWRKNYIRNNKRRTLLEDTPVWLTENTPPQVALYLRRSIENAALSNMNAFHRGYKFTGELKQLPPPDPFNIVDLIRSPLLKRMKQINYPYDKCIFWKICLVSPGESNWLYKKINIDKWILDAFSDGKTHTSTNILQVRKQSWNNLVDFAISVSHMGRNCVEAMEGTNGVLFYFTEKENHVSKNFENALKNKYPHQVIPVCVVMAKCDVTVKASVQSILASYVKDKIISEFKIFTVETENAAESMYLCTRSALKWLAKKCSKAPPIEIDYLKSLCQRYLGNDIWCKFRNEKNGRMNNIVKDLKKIVQYYNIAIDKFIEVLTNEDLFNYTSFPLELKNYLDYISPYPKPYEFIPSNVKTSENVCTIKNMLNNLKLPNPTSGFYPSSAIDMQQQIRGYCDQIGWFENTEQVVCKVVALLPNELTDLDMSSVDYSNIFAQYDLLDLLNIIVYEKINRVNNNIFAIYEKSVLQDYRNGDWLYELQVMSDMKHKIIEDKDDIDEFIQAKRRKIELDSMDYLMIEDKDSTLVEECINSANQSISKCIDYTDAVRQLEIEIEERNKKSIELENLLKAAILDV